MKQLFTLGLLLCSSFLAGQITYVGTSDNNSAENDNNNQLIQVVEVGSKKIYRMDGKTIVKKEVLDVLDNDPDTHTYTNGYKFQRDISLGMGIGGLLLVGRTYAFGIASDQRSIYASAGIGMAILGGFLRHSGNKKFKRAINVYNDNIMKEFASSPTPKLGFVSNQNGLGISLNF